MGLIPGLGRSLGWQPTPVFLPGECHGQRTLVGYSPQHHKESDTTDRLTLPTLFGQERTTGLGVIKSYPQGWAVRKDWVVGQVPGAVDGLALGFLKKNMMIWVLLLQPTKMVKKLRCPCWGLAALQGFVQVERARSRERAWAPLSRVIWTRWLFPASVSSAVKWFLYSM